MATITSSVRVPAPEGTGSDVRQGRQPPAIDSIIICFAPPPGTQTEAGSLLPSPNE
jgi:hypothetical protein